MHDARCMCRPRLIRSRAALTYAEAQSRIDDDRLSDELSANLRRLNEVHARPGALLAAARQYRNRMWSPPRLWRHHQGVEHSELQLDMSTLCLHFSQAGTGSFKLPPLR